MVVSQQEEEAEFVWARNVERMAAAMVEQFGDRALGIAEREAQAAEGNIRDTWRAIAQLLSRR